MRTALEVRFHARTESPVDLPIEKIGDLAPNLQAADFNHGHWIHKSPFGFADSIHTLPRSHLLVLELAGAPAAVNAGSESVPHLETGAEQPRLHAGNRNRQNLSRLPNAQVLDVTQNQHLTILLRKCV